MKFLSIACLISFVLLSKSDVSAQRVKRPKKGEKEFIHYALANWYRVKPDTKILYKSLVE